MKRLTEVVTKVLSEHHHHRLSRGLSALILSDLGLMQEVSRQDLSTRCPY